jgi:cytochrome c553
MQVETQYSEINSMKHQILTVLSAVALATVASVASAGDVFAGKAKSVACAGCHGADGISVVPTYPNLAGQKEAYIISTLKGFRDGTRKNAIMNPMAKPLSDADIENLAAYYASLK